MKKNTAKTARGETSRKKILDITQQLMGATSSHSVTLDQISELAHLSKSSIMWYFGSKEELLLEVIDRAFQDLVASVVKDIPEDLSSFDKLKFFIKEYERFLKKNPEMPNIFFSFYFNDKVGGRIKEKIREIYDWNRRALIENLGISPYMATSLMGFLDGVVIQASIDPKQVKVGKVFEEMLDIIELCLERKDI
jgi:AcrR family transcriptional regulator